MAEETTGGTSGGTDIIIPLSVETGNADQTLEGLEKHVDSLRSKLSQLTENTQEYIDVQSRLTGATDKLASTVERLDGIFNSVSSAGVKMAADTQVINDGMTAMSNNIVTTSDVLDAINANFKESGESAKEAAQGTERYSQTLKTLKNDGNAANLSLGELKATKKDLQAEINKTTTGSDKWAQLNRDLKLVDDTIKNVKQSQRAASGEMVAATDSVQAMRDRVKELNKEWKLMSKADPGHAAKVAELKSLRDELKEAEAEVGIFSRNVGNYKNDIKGAAAELGNFAGVFPGLSSGVSGATGMIGKMNVALKALLANPVVAILAAIVAVFMALKKALNSSEEATARFNAILAPLKMIMDGVLNILQKVVGIVLSGVEAFMDLAMSVSRFLEKIPFVGKYLKEANDAIEESVKLEQAKYELDKKTRDIQVETAKNDRDIANLKAQAAEKDKYTAEERLQFLRQAAELEKQNVDASLAIAKERLRIAEEEANRAENTKVTEEELAQLRAAVFQAETQHATKIRELNAQQVEAINQIKAERKAEEEAAAKEAEEARKAAEERAKELAEVQKRITENAMGEFELRRSQAEEQYKKDYDILVKNNQSTEELERQHQKNLAAIDAEQANKRAEAEATAASKALDEQLKARETANKALVDAENVAAAQRNAARIQAEAELLSAQTSENEAAVTAARERLAAIDAAELEHEQAIRDREAENIRLRMEIIQAGLENEAIVGAERAALQQQLADAENALLLNTASTAEAVAKRKLDTEKKRAAAEKKLDDETAKNKKKTQDTINNLVQAGLNVAGEGTVAAKALGVAQATISTYTGAAEALKNPWPLNLAAMAAVITAGLMQVKSILSVKVPGVGGSSGGGVSMPSVTPIASYTAPIVETHTNMTSDEVDEINAAQKVYVVESDISEAQNKVKVAVSESTF